jgi:predicted dehydrogenase
MSPQPQSISIAIIGFSGLIGKRHTHHCLDSSFTNLVALVDPSPTAASIASSHKVPYYATVSAMLSSLPHPPDAAIVCTPNSTHVPVARELAAAGVNLLVEKPLSTSIEEGAELVRHCREKGVKLLVGHHRRFNPYVVAAKKCIEAGDVGDVTAVSALWTNYKPSSYFDGEAVKWRSSKKMGGGVVLINLVHEVDLMGYILGRVVRVHAEKTTSRRGKGEDKAEEGCVLTLRFESGVVGTFVLSDCVVSPHNFEAGTGENPLIPRARGSGGDEVDVYRIFGTEATLSVPDMSLWKYEGERSWENELVRRKVAVDVNGKVPFQRQLEHFVGVVRGAEEPSCSGEEGLRAMMVCDAVRKALDSESGNVDIPDVDQV